MGQVSNLPLQPELWQVRNLPHSLLPTIKAVGVNTTANGLGTWLLKIERTSANDFRPRIGVRIRIVKRGVVLLIANWPGRPEQRSRKIAANGRGDDATSEQSFDVVRHVIWLVRRRVRSGRDYRDVGEVVERQSRHLRPATRNTIDDFEPGLELP